jgi:hypothetical protein
MDGVTIKNRLSVLLIICALAVRFMIPAGWMPSAERSFVVTVCTGVNMSTMWIDTKGKIHKVDPAKHKSADHESCVFAGMAMAADPPSSLVALPIMPDVSDRLVMTTIPVSIGKGLAAPPPPSTGPPVLS